MVLRKPQSDTRAFRHLKHRFSAHLMVGVFFSRRDILAYNPMITSCCFNELFIGLKKRYSM